MREIEKNCYDCANSCQKEKRFFLTDGVLNETTSTGKSTDFFTCFYNYIQTYESLVTTFFVMFIWMKKKYYVDFVVKVCCL